LQAVADCPKTLKGSETGVARTIKKECGTISVDGDYSIDGMLTIEAGVTLAFQPGSSMEVGYNAPTQLVIIGTKDAPVTFAPPTGAAETAGLWKGVHVYENAAHSTISGLVIDAAGNDKGALTIDAADVTIKDSTIKNATQFGLYLGDDATVKDVTGLTFYHAGMIDLSLPPSTVGGLGGGNKFDDGHFVQIRSGTLDHDATWQDPGTFYFIDGQVDVDGKATLATLTIQAGTELRVQNDGVLEAGYNQQAKIVVAGTKDKPVVMKGGTNDDKGRWKGLGVYGKGELDITGLTISGGSPADGQGAVFDKGGVLTIKDSKLSGNTIGISVDTGSTVKAIDGCDFEDNDKAWTLPADFVGALGTGNTYGKGAVAEIGDEDKSFLRTNIGL